MSQVAVLGAGSWGTALALQLARAGQRVKLWGHRAEHMPSSAPTAKTGAISVAFPFPPIWNPWWTCKAL